MSNETLLLEDVFSSSVFCVEKCLHKQSPINMTVLRKHDQNLSCIGIWLLTTTFAFKLCSAIQYTDVSLSDVVNILHRATSVA